MERSCRGSIDAVTFLARAVKHGEVRWAPTAQKAMGEELWKFRGHALLGRIHPSGRRWRTARSVEQGKAHALQEGLPAKPLEAQRVGAVAPQVCVVLQGMPV